MKRPVAITATVATLVLLLTGCTTPEPLPTTTTETPAPAPATGTPSATTPPAAPIDDRVTALRTVSPHVTTVLETEPGRWIISTTLTPPNSDDHTRTDTHTATTICEKAVTLGAEKVAVMNSDGTPLTLHDHPTHTCTTP